MSVPAHFRSGHLTSLPQFIHQLEWRRTLMRVLKELVLYKINLFCSECYYISLKYFFVLLPSLISIRKLSFFFKNWVTFLIQHVFLMNINVTSCILTLDTYTHFKPKSNGRSKQRSGMSVCFLLNSVEIVKISLQNWTWLVSSLLLEQW